MGPRAARRRTARRVGRAGPVSGMTTNRMLPRAGVVLALAAAAGLAVWNHTLTVAASQPVPQQSTVPVSTVLRACPAPGLAGAPTTHLALIAGPTPSGAGKAVVTYSGTSPGAPLLSVTQPGVLSLTGVRAVPAPAPAKTAHSKTAHASASASPSAAGAQAVTTAPVQGGVVIQASGSMARGLEAEQVTGDDKVIA